MDTFPRAPTHFRRLVLDHHLEGQKPDVAGQCLALAFAPSWSYRSFQLSPYACDISGVSVNHTALLLFLQTEKMPGPRQVRATPAQRCHLRLLQDYQGSRNPMTCSTV